MSTTTTTTTHRSRSRSRSMSISKSGPGTRGRTVNPHMGETQYRTLRDVEREARRAGAAYGVGYPVQGNKLVDVWDVADRETGQTGIQWDPFEYQGKYGIAPEQWMVLVRALNREGITMKQAMEIQPLRGEGTVRGGQGVKGAMKAFWREAAKTANPKKRVRGIQPIAAGTTVFLEGPYWHNVEAVVLDWDHVRDRYGDSKEALVRKTRTGTEIVVPHFQIRTQVSNPFLEGIVTSVIGSAIAFAGLKRYEMEEHRGEPLREEEIEEMANPRLIPSEILDTFTYWVVGPYSENGPAHEKGVRLQSQGFHVPYVEKSVGRWWVFGYSRPGEKVPVGPGVSTSGWPKLDKRNPGSKPHTHFKGLVRKFEARGDVDDPRALAAWIEKQKHGERWPNPGGPSTATSAGIHAGTTYARAVRSKGLHAPTYSTIQGAYHDWTEIPAGMTHLETSPQFDEFKRGFAEGYLSLVGRRSNPDWVAGDYATPKYAVHRPSGLFFGYAESVAEALRLVSKIRSMGEEPDVYAITRAGKIRIDSNKLGDRASNPSKLFDTEAGAEEYRDKLQRKGVAATVRFVEVKRAGKYIEKWKVIYGEEASDFYKAHARNPEDTAASMYETFHGRPSQETIEVEETIHYHEHLAALGEMVDLKIATTTGKSVTLTFDGDTTLSSNEDGTQLYIVGGDQSVDLKALGFKGPAADKESIVLGDLTEITYRTEKSFHKFKPIDYYHKVGEETGELPVVVYDRVNSLLSIAGGAYEIRAEGIVN